MKYLLCLIETLHYAVPARQVVRIEEPDRDDRLSPRPWQSYLREGSQVGGNYSARILLEAQPELVPLYVEEVIDISAEYEGEVSTFPNELVDAPEGIFSGIILLDGLPYIVISASDLAKEQENAQGA
jgi:hypothetical protein